MDDTILEYDIARIPPVLVAEDAHQRRDTARVKRLHHSTIGSVKPGIAVGDEEFGPEPVKRPADRASGADQFWAIDDILDLQAESAAIARECLDLLPTIADQKLDVLNALASAKPQLMGEEGLAGHFEQSLRQLLGQRSHTRRQPAGKYGDRRHSHHWIIVLEPSKSKRKRTSSRPCSNMA